MTTKEILEKTEKIQETAQKLLESWDNSNLEKLIPKIGILVQKLVSFSLIVKDRIINSSKELSEIYLERYSYYKLDFEIKLSSSEIKDFIEKDSKYLSKQIECQQLDNCFSIIQETIKNLNNTRYDIKNFIEYLKLRKELEFI